MQVTFLSRRDAEDALPSDGYHLISISDGPEDQAAIDESRWASVSYHYFIDAGFDEDTIAQFGGDGGDFETRFRDYFLEDRAEVMRQRIAAIVELRQPIVVNCQAGKSRSAAVAKFISTHYGYQLDKPTPEANMCVYRMLARDGVLIRAYRSATALETHSDQHASASVLGSIKRFFGF
ncbi:hypothetical protein KZ843_09205 [Pseudomonas aeruginosa]|nr:hypothetical protein [Pseudomonas aeruginosa]MBW6123060.1 hypothetical protein [Pseudomonas aeruginosa]